jgi:hypothetical protein
MDNSDMDQVAAFLRGFVDSFDFTRPGKEQSLGRDVAGRIVERIADRAVKERRGANSKWQPNSSTPSRSAPKGYRGWKADAYGVGEDAANERTGQMLSPTSLYGRTRIEAKEITMVYGTGGIAANHCPSHVGLGGITLAD